MTLSHPSGSRGTVTRWGQRKRFCLDAELADLIQGWRTVACWESCDNHSHIVPDFGLVIIFGVAACRGIKMCHRMVASSADSSRLKDGMQTAVGGDWAPGSLIQAGHSKTHLWVCNI